MKKIYNKKKETIFFCNVCVKEKIGKKHKIYDENWNFTGCYECEECFVKRMNEKYKDYEI